MVKFESYDITDMKKKEVIKLIKTMKKRGFDKLYTFWRKGRQILVFAKS